jgi:hypothetical protein
MNDLRSSLEWNQERIAHAKLEFPKPIAGIIGGIREGVRGIFQSAGKLATDLVTRPLAGVVNMGRLALDAATRLPPRVALISADFFSEKTFGTASKWIRNFREKIFKALSPKEAHGGHDAHGAAHGLDAHAKASHGGGHATPAHGH